MRQKRVRQIGFGQISSYLDMDYIDEDIALYEDFRAIPALEEGAVQIDMCMMVVCVNGRMEVDINGEHYNMERNNVMVVRPSVLIENCMFSPNFKGSILCLSDRLIIECLSQSDLWNRAFYFLDNPVVTMSEEHLRMFGLYKELLQMKISTGQTLFRSEIVMSLVRAVLYELLAMTNGCILSVGENSLRQRDVLFKRFFILLSGCKVKPRFVAWYADQLCITPKHLSAVCKQVCGRTALDIIGEYVQIDIRRLLKSSDRSVKELADYLGFPNISFFGKYCRTHFGMSPLALRKTLRGQKG